MNGWNINYGLKKNVNNSLCQKKQTKCNDYKIQAQLMEISLTMSDM